MSRIYYQGSAIAQIFEGYFLRMVCQLSTLKQYLTVAYFIEITINLVRSIRYERLKVQKYKQPKMDLKTGNLPSTGAITAS